MNIDNSTCYNILKSKRVKGNYTEKGLNEFRF